MFTAKLKSKDTVNGTVHCVVTFTDGTKSVDETVIPSDMVGLKHWIRGRLATFNFPKVMETVDVGTEIKDEVVELTTEEIATEKWFSDFRKMERVQKLVDLGVFPSDQAQIVALRNKLQADFKLEYIDLM